jgi:hypothetical protein
MVIEYGYSSVSAYDVGPVMYNYSSDVSCVSYSPRVFFNESKVGPR